MVLWSWVNFQCWGVLLVWIRVGQGPTALAVGAGGGCLDIFSLIYPFSSLSPSLWGTTRYRLKYCLKGSLSPKTTNQQSFYGINLRILWTELKIVVVQVDKEWFDEVSPTRANKGNETLPFYLRNQSYHTNSMYWDS